MVSEVRSSRTREVSQLSCWAGRPERLACRLCGEDSRPGLASFTGGRAEGCRDGRELVEGGLEIFDDLCSDDLGAGRFSESSRDVAQERSALPEVALPSSPGGSGREEVTGER